MATWDQERYIKAWNFATHAHGSQTFTGHAQGSELPYINHLGRVAMEVIWANEALPFDQADLAIECALLHDVLEDTDTTYAALEAAFGKATAEGVLALTKFEEVGDKRAQMEDSLKRIWEQPLAVWTVKLADRITNLSPPPHHWNESKIESYKAEAELIYEALHSAHPLLAARLREKIEAYPNT
jgi:(p)ppGpp synthase/HD superfamily hydrolase